jgi:plasmid stability protein
MANLSIKGVPDDLAERLRQRAARNHRSLQGELMAIIEQAADEPAPASPYAFQRRGKPIEQIAAEHRARFPQPIASGPDAVDIIRTERDAR